MSKLTKLLSDPRAFVADSWIKRLLDDPRSFAADSKPYRRLSLLASHAREVIQNARVTPIASSDAKVAKLVAELGKRTAILDLTLPGSVEVATLRSETHAVTAFLFDLQRKKGVDVTVEVPRRSASLAGAHLFAIDDMIAASPLVTARIAFANQREELTVKFHFWQELDGFFVGPRPHPIARRIPKRVVDRRRLFEKGRVVHARELHACRLPDEPTFPIDVVYTWVNHDDASWRRLRAEATGVHLDEETDDARSLERFLNRDELRYSLRSIADYAPWVRKIWIATNCAPPPWLDTAHPKIEWVDHAAFIPAEALPTFSSHAIESRLQHIPGLANHFLYFNDDFFLTRPTVPGDFFLGSGLSRSFLEDYATVIGDTHPDDPDYLNAARNGKKLMEQAFECSPACLHQHLPYALRKDVLLEMEQRFAEPIRRTTRARFRTPQDISTVSFLYHHYAYCTGRAIYDRADAVLVKAATPRYEKRLVDLIDTKRPPLAVCLNDGAGSAQSERWGQHVQEFLAAYFPRPCEYERPTADLHAVEAASGKPQRKATGS